MTLAKFSCVALAAGMALVASACDKDEQPATSAAEADGGVSSAKPALDPNLAQAVASAAGPVNGVASPAASGPPASGVFAPGAADKELPRGAPAKITLGSEGSEPRVALSGNQPKPGTKRSGQITLTMTTGPRQNLPPIDFALTFEAKKAAAAVPEGSPAPVQVVVNVTNASVTQAPNLPPEFTRALGKLKGSRIEYQVAANGAGDNFEYTLAQGADPGLDNAIRALTDTIATLTLPFPEKPLGAGGFFMAATRETSVGIDVVNYKLVKVTAVSGDTVTLSINSKRYATDAKFEMPGLPTELGALSLEEWNSTAEGSATVVKGTPFPVEGQITQMFTGTLNAEKQPDQKLAVQAQSRAQFTLK